MKKIPIKSESGDALMFMLIVGIIATLIASGAMAGVFGILIRAFGMEDLICPIVCEKQTDIEEMGSGDWVRGLAPWNWRTFGGDRVTTSEVFGNAMFDIVNQPEGLGCYCGVIGLTAYADEDREYTYRKGKYIHAYSWDFDRLGEFHITSENPTLHLQNHMIDRHGEVVFSHTGAGDIEDNEVQGKSLDACKEAAGGPEELRKLDEYEGCIIFSVMASYTDDEPKECSIYGFEKGAVLNNEMSGTIAPRAEDEYHSDYLYTIARDPMKTRKIGDTIFTGHSNEEFGDYHRPSQRMLLEEYRRGEHAFELYAPIVCSSTDREDQEVESEFDQACLKQCRDDGNVFWMSSCLDGPRQGYQQLRWEYRRGEGAFCSEMVEEPYCMCLDEVKEYHWEVREDYDSEIDTVSKDLVEVYTFSPGEEGTIDLDHGTYYISVKGADGGDSSSDDWDPGQGGFVRGNFHVDEDEDLELTVEVGEAGDGAEGGSGLHRGGDGAEGLATTGDAGGGGGSTELWINYGGNDEEFLAAADGGGGPRYEGWVASFVSHGGGGGARGGDGGDYKTTHHGDDGEEPDDWNYEGSIGDPGGGRGGSYWENGVEYGDGEGGGWEANENILEDIEGYRGGNGEGRESGGLVIIEHYQEVNENYD